MLNVREDTPSKQTTIVPFPAAETPAALAVQTTTTATKTAESSTSTPTRHPASIQLPKSAAMSSASTQLPATNSTPIPSPAASPTPSAAPSFQPYSSSIPDVSIPTPPAADVI